MTNNQELISDSVVRKKEERLHDKENKNRIYWFRRYHMLARERVFKTLNHQEPDLVPWGEHWIDYNVYEDILGRETVDEKACRAIALEVPLGTTGLW